MCSKKEKIEAIREYHNSLKKELTFKIASFTAKKEDKLFIDATRVRTQTLNSSLLVSDIFYVDEICLGRMTTIVTITKEHGTTSFVVFTGLDEFCEMGGEVL